MKQSKDVELNSVQNSQKKERSNNLYIRVETFNTEGREIGTRIVDLYHTGTRNWMSNHQWWAFHNGHTVEINVANSDEVNAYIDKQAAILAERFNTEKAHVAA